MEVRGPHGTPFPGGAVNLRCENPIYQMEDYKNRERNVRTQGDTVANGSFRGIQAYVGEIYLNSENPDVL